MRKTFRVIVALMCFATGLVSGYATTEPPVGPLYLLVFLLWWTEDGGPLDKGDTEE